jgi:hypothetical protein
MTSATVSLPGPPLPLARAPYSWRWAFGAVVLVVGALGSLLIVDASWPYLLPDGVHPFMHERPALRDWAAWRVSLGLHTAGGLVCLPLGLALLTPAAARRRRLHVVLGRLYGVLVVLVLFPTGLLLGLFAKGGLVTAPGFIGSGLLATWALIVAIERARRGDLAGHRAFMIRSWAQLASAITFRLAHVALQLAVIVGVLELEHAAVYAASLWTSVLGNAALAELYLRRPSTSRHLVTQGAPS